MKRIQQRIARFPSERIQLRRRQIAVFIHLHSALAHFERIAAELGKPLFVGFGGLRLIGTLNDSAEMLRQACSVRKPSSQRRRFAHGELQ